MTLTVSLLYLANAQPNRRQRSRFVGTVCSLAIDLGEMRCYCVQKMEEGERVRMRREAANAEVQENRGE